MKLRLSDIRHYLSRESSSGRFIPAIDGLRFVAIFAVICHHLNGFLLVKTGHTGPRGFLSNLCVKGSFGVQLFFVISGFIIAYPFARAAFTGHAQPGLGRYFTRRLSRLEPPYILNLVLTFALLVLTDRAVALDLLPNLLASMTYTHNLVYGQFSAVNCVAWSLEVELQFYVLAPLMARVFRMRSAAMRRAGLVVFVLSCSLAAQLFLVHAPRFRLSVLPFLGYFLAGFLLCDIYCGHWREAPSAHWLWDVVGLGAWSAVPALMWTPFDFVLPLVVVLAYGASLQGVVLRSFFSNWVVYTVGGMCYTIYLYHFLIISAVGRVFLSPVTTVASAVWVRLLVLTVLVVPVVVFSCALLFAITERPFMVRDWPQKLWRLLVGVKQTARPTAMASGGQ